MNLHKNNNVVKHDLGDRLMVCVDRVGGKRALATAALISEAQLFRYINGDTDVPSEKLVAIAEAANVDPSWLLTGTGEMAHVIKNGRPAFRPMLLMQLTQEFESLLIEYDKPFTPRQRAQTLTFMYEALRHEEVLRGYEINPTRTEMVGFLNYLCDLRTDSLILGFSHVMEVLEYGAQEGVLNAFDSEQFVNLVKRGYEYFYNSMAGQSYFDRATTQLPQRLQQRWTEVLSLLKQSSPNTPWSILDLGCGNGRELSYLWRQDPTLTVAGIELSPRGVQLAQQLIDAGKLPENSVRQGDINHIPHQDKLFDLVNCRSVLSCVPYLEDSHEGVNGVFREVKRVLKPGGLFSLQIARGHGREYLPFQQLFEFSDVEKLAQAHNFEIVVMRPHLPLRENHSKAMIDYPQKYDYAIFAVLKAK